MKHLSHKQGEAGSYPLPPFSSNTLEVRASCHLLRKIPKDAEELGSNKEAPNSTEIKKNKIQKRILYLISVYKLSSNSDFEILFLEVLHAFLLFLTHVLITRIPYTLMTVYTPYYLNLRAH